MTSMPIIELNGQRTWVLVPKKKGEIVLLLHGGMSSSASLLSSIGPHLKKRFRLAAFDRRGHGKSPDNDRPFHYADMAEETITEAGPFAGPLDQAGNVGEDKILRVREAATWRCW